MFNEASITETFTAVKNSLATIIGGMEDNTRIITEDLIGKISAETNVHPIIAAGITKLCLQNSTVAYQRPGKNGGVWKGQPKTKKEMN